MTNAKATCLIGIQDNKNGFDKVLKFLESKVKDVCIDTGNDQIDVMSTSCFGTKDEIVNLAEQIKSILNDENFCITGFINSCDVAEELCDFEITNRNKKLNISFSEWYQQIYMNDYLTYKQFCNDFPGYSEEEYNQFVENEYVYLVEKENKLYLNIPMTERKEI